MKIFLLFFFLTNFKLDMWLFHKQLTVLINYFIIINSHLIKIQLLDYNFILFIQHFYRLRHQ